MGRRSLANAEKAVEFAQLALSHQGAERERFYSLSRKFANRINPYLFKEYHEARYYFHHWHMRGDELKALEPFYGSLSKLVEELHSLWDTYLKSLPGNAQTVKDRLMLAKFFKKVQRPDLSIIHALEVMPSATDESSAARDFEMLGALDDVIKLFRGREISPVFKSWFTDGAHTFLLRFLGRNVSAYKAHVLFGKLERLITEMFDIERSAENACENLAKFERYAELIETNFAEHDLVFLELAANVWENVFDLARQANAQTDRLVEIKNRIIDYYRQLEVQPKWQHGGSHAAIANALHTIATLRANADNPDHQLVSEAFEASSRGWVEAERWTKAIDDLCDAARHAELAGDRKRASRLRLSAVLDAKKIDEVNWMGAFSRISSDEGERRRARTPLVPQIDAAGFEDISVAAHTGPRPSVLAGSMGEPRVAYHYDHHHHYEPLRPNPALMRSLYEWPIFGGDMFAPPAEKQPYVLRLVLTKGCDYGACTFCSGYAGVPPTLLSGDEFRQHVDGVFEFLSQSANLRVLDLRRVFIGSGDAMGVPFDELYEALRYTQNAFSSATGRTRADRVSIYATTRSILKRTPEELRKLRQFLDLVYWGVESGSDEVLRYVRKGTSHSQMAEAAARLNEAGIGISAMIMTGLGGVKFSDAHIIESARLLTRMDPKFVTFMGVNAGPDTAYAQTMDEEKRRGENRPLTARESALQLADMIDRMTLPDHARAGSFPPDVDCVGQNALPFPNTHMDDVRRENLVASLRLRASILGSTPETIIPAAVRALSDFVADGDQNILLRLYAAQLIGSFGAWAQSALPLLKKFEQDYSSSGKIEAVSWAIEKIEASARKSTTTFPDNETIAKNIKDMPMPSDAYRRTGVNWLGDFLQDLLALIMRKP